MVSDDHNGIWVRWRIRHCEYRIPLSNVLKLAEYCDSQIADEDGDKPIPIGRYTFPTSGRAELLNSIDALSFSRALRLISERFEKDDSFGSLTLAGIDHELEMLCVKPV